jgi:proline iminopeptidase
LQPVSELLKSDFRVLRFEQRGCGRSISDPPFDVDTLIDDIEAIRTAYDVEQWVVGGHSWGANIALAYSLAFPERTSAVLYISGPGLSWDDEWRRQYKLARSTIGELKPVFRFPSNMAVNREGNASWQTYLSRENLLSKVSASAVRMLLVRGSADIRPDREVQRLARLTPNADYREIKGAGHYIWLSHAEDLKVVLCDFLARPESFAKAQS